MVLVLALLAAGSYGASDFFAGLASRRLAVGPVTLLVQLAALIGAGVGVLLLPGAGPTSTSIGWGAVAGVGSALGTLTLYRGMVVGAMSPVAACSAVLAAALPALVGLASGERLSGPVGLGLAIALPAIGLVSWQRPQPDSGHAPHALVGVGYGTAAGVGFGLLFVALDRAGDASGAWPVLSSATVAALLVAPFAGGAGRPVAAWRPSLPIAAAAGLLGCVSNLLFLAASGRGQLAVVAVLTSLYPAVTVLLARLVLLERWSMLQVVGMVAATGAVLLISAG